MFGNLISIRIFMTRKEITHTRGTTTNITIINQKKTFYNSNIPKVQKSTSWFIQIKRMGIWKDGSGNMQF